ncbi:hypothetical protein M758_8G176700 [Ceratodon purpureus]|uniref:Prokaryotic-type class I peptide chain release factors domain-containing protein n=1 Tax=Ceratodon purpureus TaxID=3225 RepID=A0A8T0H8B9_CERPU|nr:hypothetical protein KC19_8G181700 [Ceratodon purpureus]KAG0609336.1 hypothetical protein M758_8G176700 [Ceratodon purpureus]
MWAASVRHRLGIVLGRSVWAQQQRGVFAAGQLCKPRDEGDDGLHERGGAAEVTARGWHISAESESDWRSHAAAVARSVDLIKARLQWKKVLSRLQELDAELAKPNLWEDAAKAGQFSRERGALAGQVKSVVSMEEELLEHVGLAELAYEESDAQVAADATRGLAELRKIASERELVALLSGEHDSRSCFIEVQAGAGGTESMDWASMVMRMYKMWAQNRDYEVTVVDEMPGEEAGIKRATIRVDGLYAYGYAKTEAGVHRLVRISPFDAGKRRHTSFAAVAVIPALDESEVNIEIDETDLRIERFRAGGAGGQHVNKTESAVRIIHLPTGIVVQCQADRSQHRNKATALNMLQSRLYQMEVTRRAKANAQHTQALSDVSWGSQIRSYVLQPYQMVKDLRTNYEVSDPSSVLDGEIDGFILAYLANSSTS